MEKLRSPEVIEPLNNIFVAQRGEMAVRFLEACEKRLQKGEKIGVVLPYTFSDHNPLASKIVAEHTTDGWVLTPVAGTSPEQNFANADRLIMSAKINGCDGIFLGAGFLAENAGFVERCRQEGLRPLAPPTQAMEAVGNKIKAREIARSVKIGRLATIPVVEGSDDLKNFEEAVKAAEHFDYPVMLKDPDLGGGSGNLAVRNRKDLEAAYKTLKGRPENRELFIERYIEHAVHVEVQIVADKYGNVVALGERDCSTQRKGQKIIEESPSPQISSRLRSVLQKAAVNFAKAVSFQGIGTWEFIVDLDKKGRAGDPAWYFMEVNPRLQVEHRVTEETTGVDLVELMMSIEEGKPFSFTQSQIQPKGWAMELRIYAEDPMRNFEVTPGKVSIFGYPDMEGVRLAPAISEGDVLSAWYDHTLMLAVARGATREEARTKLVEFTSRMEIAGVANNLPFGLAILNSDRFRDGRITTRFAEEFWRNQIKQRIHSGGLANSGSISTQQPSFKFVYELLPQNVEIIRDNKPVAYNQYIEEVQRRTGKDSAAEYYVIERDGVRFVLYDLDYNYQGGTLGIQEGNIFEDACRLANKEHLPLVSISRSGGANQWQNSLALFQMGRTVAVLGKYPPALFINVYAGPVYGGVPASFAGVADIQMAVDSPDTHIGFSGPYIVAETLGKKPASFRPEDSYKILPEGTHTPVAHYQDRNIHILVSNLEEAGDTISHLIRINRQAFKEAIVNPNLTFKPKEDLPFREIYGRALRYDRAGRRFPAWMRRFSGFLDRQFRHREEEYMEPLTVAQKMAVLSRGDRPTAADLLDPNLGLVDDARFLTSPPFEFADIQQYPTIIAAFANIDKFDLFVLGQQTQRVYDEDTKTRRKKYEGQKPADWEYTMHMLGVARKLHLPLLLLGDTNGADPSPESESRNQSHKIARVIAEVNRYPYPVLSGSIGLKGSGGGETFIKPADFAFDGENALSFVATPLAQYWILTKKWIDQTASDEEKAELVWYMNQLKDATAEGRLQLKMIDTIIREGPGGAHRNPQFFARQIRNAVTQVLPSLLGLSQKELLNRRWERVAQINRSVSIPFSS